MVFLFDAYELNAERLELRRAGKLVKADGLVLRLLACLVRNAGRLVTKEELVNDVWKGRAVADNAITVSVARLRKTLGHRPDQPEFVVTVYGRGYRFVGEVAVGTAASATGPTVPPSADSQPLFVGRERVLSRLRQALNETSAGRGRACVLIGEPGIGKTRAIEALERELVGTRVRVAWGYCRESGDTPPLWPWLRLLREVIAASSRPELERALGPAMAEVLALGEELRGVEPIGASGAKRSDLRSPPAGFRGIDAILRTFALAAEQAPWILVLDDLHRADAASLELFSHLLDQIGRTRILVVATLRPATSAPHQEALLPHVAGHRNSERIELERLPEADVAKYVAALLDDPSGSLGRAVFAKSEGNPFFMVELSRELRDADQPDGSALAVGDAALDLIRERVSRLDAEARGVLSAAAVIGRSFELPLLQSITGRDPSALMSSLDDALDTEVVVAATDSVTAFAFGHELLRSVLYDALSPAERRRWHIRIAEVLELRMNTGSPVPPSELAYHFYAALPESDLRKTVHFCREAATAASRVGNPDVVRYLRHALEALALIPDGSTNMRLTLLFITANFARACAPTECLGALNEVLVLARELGDGPMMVRAAFMLNPHPGFKPLPGVRAALDEALPLLPAEQDGLRGVALAGLAAASPDCFRIERNHQLLDEAEVFSRKSGSRVSLYGTLLYKLYSYGGPAHAQIAAATLSELERLAQDHPQRLPVLPVDLALYRTISECQRGDVAAAKTALERAEARSRELRHVELIWHCERLQAIARINAGERLDCLATLTRLHRQAEHRRLPATEPFCAFDRTVIFAEFGEAAVMDDDLRRALAFDASEPPAVWALKVRALATVGLVDEARLALSAVAAADLAQLPCDRDYLGTLGHLTRAALLLHARDYAEAIYPLLAQHADLFTCDMAYFSEGSVAHLLGMLARVLGRRAQAIAHFQTGIRLNEGAGLVLRAAEARAQLAALTQAEAWPTSDSARPARH